MCIRDREGDGGHAAELQRQKEKNAALLSNPGTENPFKIWRELGETMTKHATILRYNPGLDQADAKIVELLDRFRNVNRECLENALGFVFVDIGLGDDLDGP